MESTPASAATPDPSLGRRIITFPLVRIVLAVAVVTVAMMAVQFAVRTPLRAAYGGKVPQALGLVVAIPVLLTALAAYIFFVRVVERRGVSELAPRRAAAGLGAGTALGIGLIALTVGTIGVLGGWSVDGTHAVAVLAPALAMALYSGFVEEIVFRGIIFRMTEEGLGTWAALAITSLLFGAAHLANDNATAWGAIAIALEAGLLLGAAYAAARSLWLPIGIHVGWNLAERGLFGAPVSGIVKPGLLISRFEGSKLLTGGAFGPEASLAAVLICMAVALLLLSYAIRRGRMVPPWWRRRKEAPAA